MCLFGKVYYFPLCSANISNTILYGKAYSAYTRGTISIFKIIFQFQYKLSSTDSIRSII